MSHTPTMFFGETGGSASEIVARKNPTGSAVAVKEDLVFVSNIRFWSMISIVAVHCLYACSPSDATLGGELQIALVQLMKFGTISFFLISGFLLGERLHRGSRCEYIARRFKNTAAPWALWAGIYYAASIVITFAVQPHSLTGRELYVHAKAVVFHSPYWFVPNFLLCLTLLSLLRRFIKNLFFGLVLLMASLFYGVNAYIHWIAPSHTAALVGFAFYQWLGVWAAHNFARVSKIVDRLPWTVLISAATVAGFLGLLETHLMMARFSLSAIDSLNSLRITNQMFSVAAVVVLFKVKRPLTPSFVKVRVHTYGIFLIHPVCLLTVGPFAQWITAMSQPLTIGASLLLFGMVYTMALVATMAISGTSLGWLVGPNDKGGAEGADPRTKPFADSSFQPQADRLFLRRWLARLS
jgi:membrane-bound acyltransferase YfiQ involved in biofilm formation